MGRGHSKVSQRSAKARGQCEDCWKEGLQRTALKREVSLGVSTCVDFVLHFNFYNGLILDNI